MKYNPTRRGNFKKDNSTCLCGWSRKKKRYVTNGCPIHKHKPILVEPKEDNNG